MNKTITGTISGMELRQNTVDANPRWVIELDANRTYTTKDDTACAYLPDFEHKGETVTLTLDGRGQVIGYKLGGQMSNEWSHDDLPAVTDMADELDGDAERYGASVAKRAILDYLNRHYRKVPK